MGKLADLLKRQFGIETQQVINSLVSAVGVTSIPIVTNNPDRVGLTIINLSLHTIYISPIDPATTTHGIVLMPSGGSIVFVWDEDFELVSYTWNAIASGSSCSVLILEMIARESK